MDDYRVNLPDFHGPLDLLLHLVKRSEVDIRDIPIAVIADQFLAYMDVLRAVDVELAGDFLVTAATLMEIKSRLMLPGGAAASPDKVDDPRSGLVHQLLEYKRNREAAAALQKLATTRDQRQPRGQSPQPAISAPAVEVVELWDLVAAFGRLMHEASTHEPKEVVADETPQHVYLDEMRSRVAQGGRLTFRDAFTPPHRRMRLIGLFLALLELIKQGEVSFEQDRETDELWLCATRATTSCPAKRETQ